MAYTDNHEEFEMLRLKFFLLVACLSFALVACGTADETPANDDVVETSDDASDDTMRDSLDVVASGGLEGAYPDVVASAICFTDGTIYRINYNASDILSPEAPYHGSVSISIYNNAEAEVTYTGDDSAQDASEDIPVFVRAYIEETDERPSFEMVSYSVTLQEIASAEGDPYIGTLEVVLAPEEGDLDNVTLTGDFSYVRGSCNG